MKYVDIRGLPPCPLSPQCLRLLDDLDVPLTARAPGQLAYIEDLQDERQLRQLRSHVPGCPTCSALLAEARHTRTQQRTMLYHFLLTNEQHVPSTSQTILVALHREQAQQEAQEKHTKRAYTRVQALSSARKQGDEMRAASPLSLQARAFPSRSLLQNMLTLATVVAVILAAIGLLNRASNPTSSPASKPPVHPQQPEVGTGSTGWNSVVIGLTLISAAGLMKSFTVYNFNTSSEQMGTLLPPVQDISNPRMQEISSDGQSLLYEVTSPGQQTTYYTTFSMSAGSHRFYHLGAQQAGNAIWMGTRHVLAQNTQGSISDVDVQSDSVQQTWPLKAVRLSFYHQPFLYFIGTENLATSTLYRLNLAQSGAVPQQVTAAPSHTRFWLAPDGTTIFYAQHEPGSAQGIYAVSSDGTHQRKLNDDPGIPIGYAEDNALMLLQQVGTRVQVVKLGATANQPEQVVLADVAPQTTSLCGPASRGNIIALCDQNIALAPYGHGLLIHAYYADGSHSLVYDDLTTGTSRKVFPLPANATVQLPGWSRMSTSTTAAVAPSTLCA